MTGSKTKEEELKEDLETLVEEDSVVVGSVVRGGEVGGRGGLTE